MTIWSIIQQHRLKVIPCKYDIVIPGAGDASRGVPEVARSAGKSIACVEFDDGKKRDRSVETRKNRTAFDLAEGEVRFQRTDPRRTGQLVANKDFIIL